MPERRSKNLTISRLFAACDILAAGIEGVADDARRRSAAITLARLMFLSFVAARGWPAGDRRSLRQRLEDAPAVEHDHGCAFAVSSLLHGSNVQRHNISAPSVPFRLEKAALNHALAILAELDWQLDSHGEPDAGRPAPATIGYLFEQYIERKRAGIYYTGTDVTAYIATHTIIPCLFDILSPRATALASELASRDPLRYIRAAMHHGSELELPATIAAGIADVTRRGDWNSAAPASFALRGETWRDVIARRRQLEETVRALRAGTVDPASLITLNIDMMRLAHDLCAAWPPERLPDLEDALARLTVLDPTCGSGAFLCAAFDVLAGLAHAIASRRARPLPGAWLQAIIERNLYGVDVMPEAVEICCMRLWLHMTDGSGAAVQPGGTHFNIYCGDALTGNIAPAQVPTTTDAHAISRTTAEDALDWRATFPQVMARGGFDVVIGNPPYVVRRGLHVHPALRTYRTAATGNLYALVVERALDLLQPQGRLGMIVPIASVATDGMAQLQQLYAPLRQWHSHYAVRPGKLFPDVDMNLTITLLQRAPSHSERYVSGYRRWRSSERGHLFETLRYTPLPPIPGLAGPLPKLGSELEVRLLQRMLSHGHQLHEYLAPGGTLIHYHSGGRYWRKALPEKLSSHYRPLRIVPAVAPVVLALLNSQLFYWYWIAFSNCMDVVAREVLHVPVFPLETADPAPFQALTDRLLALYREGATARARRGVRIRVDETSIDARRARPALDAIDRLLAHHYGFDDEQLDFVLSYDHRFRHKDI